MTELSALLYFSIRKDHSLHQLGFLMRRDRDLVNNKDPFRLDCLFLEMQELLSKLRKPKMMNCRHFHVPLALLSEVVTVPAL